MNNTNIISGKEFKNALVIGKKYHSNNDINEFKKLLNGNNYIGFTKFKFGKNSFVVYTMKLNIDDITINGSNIKGFFIHSIYDVILDEHDSKDIKLVLHSNRNKNKINKICKEYFEGIWFTKENRMLIYGTSIDTFNEDIPICRENYDIYINNNYIIGKRAFKKGIISCNDTNVPLLSDNDVFTEYIYMFKINESALCFSSNILRNNIIDYLSILKNDNHSYSINSKIWIQTDISCLLNNYNDITYTHDEIKEKVKEKYYCQKIEDKVIIDTSNINYSINKNDIINFDGIFFIPDTTDSTIIGNVWKMIDENDIFIGKNIYDDYPEFVSYANSLLNCNNNCCDTIIIRETILEHFKIEKLKEYDYMCLKDDNGAKYFKQKINEENIIVTIDITSITNIKQIEQKFECVFRVKVEWLPSITDLYYILSYGKTNYNPSWKPLNILFLNKYEIKSEKQEGPFLYKNNDKYKNVIYYYYNISFIDKVELNNFPFDIQDLEIEIEIPKCEKYEINWILNKNENIINHLSEWRYLIVQHSPHNNPMKKYKRIIHIFVKRNYWVYVWRIIFVMSLISLVSFFNISIDPFENLGERITYSVTLFLTSIAYSIVTTTYLPILGNQTLMDWYIFHVYIYLGSNMGVISLIPYYNSEIVEKYDVLIHYIYLGIWFLWHIAFIIRIKYFIIPQEYKKINKHNVVEFFCDYCGICGLYWEKTEECDILKSDIIYKNILLKNEIKNLYEKLKTDIITLKESTLNELLLHSIPIKRNYFISIGDSLFFKPVCGTKNQLYINASKEYKKICYECGKISNNANKYENIPLTNDNNYNI